MTSDSDFVPQQQNDKIVAVIGTPGAGKTTVMDLHLTICLARLTKGQLIDNIVGRPERPPSRLSYRNEGIEPSRHPHPFLPNKSLVILEAGCYDEDLSASLDSIEEWMKDRYTKNTVLSGVIYVHSIQKNRVPHMDALLQIRLEPSSRSKSFVIATTFWKSSSTRACAREAQLEGEHWSNLIKKGASPVRFDKDDPNDGGRILRHLLSRRSNGDHLHYIFNKIGPSFVNSGAGRKISGQIERILRHEKECMANIPAFLDDSPPAAIPPTISDELQKLEHQIHKLHERISKLRSSFAHRLFARIFG